MALKPILEQLYVGGKAQAYDTLQDIYTKKGWCIINFLYFANGMHWRLFESQAKKAQAKKAQADKAKSYIQALGASDLLLPDGIALQWFANWHTGASYANLNGTDFLPYVLDRFITEGKKIHIGVYSVYDPTIGKSVDELSRAVTYLQERRGIQDIHAFQSLYKERGKEVDRGTYQLSLDSFSGDVRLFLVCTGSPHQETWCQQYTAFFEKNNLLVANAGGLLDYRSGFEKRAPDWVIKSRVLETPWRIIQHPKKNIKKFWRMFGIVRYVWYRIKIVFKKQLRTGK